MKNQLRSILTTTAAALATVVLGATSASAASLSETLFPYLPTEDRQPIEADNVNLFETALPDFSNLDANYDSLDLMFLGELAGYKNTLGLSVNGAKTSIFENIKAYCEIYGCGTFSTAFNDVNGDKLDVGTVWNSKTDGGIEGFSKGENLNFWLNPNGENDGNPEDTFDMYSSPSMFKAYQLEGFEEYTILTLEDTKGKYSDNDYNDLVFAVRMNPAEDIPEPSTTLALLGVGAAGLVLRRKSLTK